MISNGAISGDKSMNNIIKCRLNLSPEGLLIETFDHTGAHSGVFRAEFGNGFASTNIADYAWNGEEILVNKRYLDYRLQQLKDEILSELGVSK
jgi:CYTH domain-containing protein